MNVSIAFFVAALVLFLFAWLGVTVIPGPVAGGLVFLTLGLLFGGVPLPWRRG